MIQYSKVIIKAEQGERLCTDNDTKKDRELKSAFSILNPLLLSLGMSRERPEARPFLATHICSKADWTLSQARTCLHGPMATPTPIKFKYERAQHGTCTWNELQETLGWINGWVNSSNPTENKNTVLGHRASLWRSSLYPPARLRSPASPSLHLPTLPAALPALVASCPAPAPSASQHLWVQTPPRGPTARSHEWHATVQAAWG